MSCTNTVKWFCAMLAVAGWLVAAGPAFGQDQTLEGTLSNTHCGLKHATASADAAGCVNACINSQNAKYALVVGDKLYTLEGGDKAQLQKQAGLSTKVTGRVDGATIHVKSIAPGSAPAGSSHSAGGCMM